MNIVMSPTLETTVLDGCEVRRYEGITDDGTRCHVMVACLVPDDHAAGDALRAQILSHLSALESAPAAAAIPPR